MRARSHPPATQAPSQVALAAYLAEHRMFSVLPRPAIDDLARGVTVRPYPKGHHLFQNGDPASYVFLVRSGLVAFTEADDRGNVHATVLLAMGDVTGLAPTVFGVRHHRTATAILDTEALLIDREPFTSTYYRFPELAHQVTRELYQMMRRAERASLLLARTPISARLAAFLLESANQLGCTSGNGSGFDLAMSKQDLALLLGTSRETISRALARLAKDGIVSSRGRRVRVLQPAALHDLAGA